MASTMGRASRPKYFCWNNDHRWQTLCKRWMALTHMSCQLLLWVKLAQTHWTPGYQNITWIPCTLPPPTSQSANFFLVWKFSQEEPLLHCSVLECTWNARGTLPCAPSDARSSWTWKWRCNVSAACQLFRPREKMSIIWHLGSRLPSYLVSQKWHLNLLSSPLCVVLCWKMFWCLKKAQ